VKELCMKQGFHGRWRGMVFENYSFFSIKLLYNIISCLCNLFEPHFSFWADIQYLVS
jgi:hypothetical protein